MGCKWCGEPIPAEPLKRGTPRVFCVGGCRRQWHIAHRWDQRVRKPQRDLSPRLIEVAFTRAQRDQRYQRRVAS